MRRTHGSYACDAARIQTLEIPTTVQIFPHSKSNYLKNMARAQKVEGLQNYLANRRSLGNWLELSKKLFDSVLQTGGIWHLYGHSAEIADLGLWEDLEQILDYVSQAGGRNVCSKL